MIFLYIGVPAIFAILALIFRHYKKEIFNNLDNKEHPLKFLYPATARVLDFFQGSRPIKNATNKINILMKQLCIKENVDSELYIYKIKKISSVICIFVAICIVGMFLCLTKTGSGLIKSLTRGSYGEGQISYQLDAEYDGTVETIEITLDEMSYSEEEALALFENSYDEIISQFLGENEALDNITSSVNLISSYNDINITWSISDTTLLNYNGEISSEIEENEFFPLSLTMQLTLGTVSEVYSIPVVLSGVALGANELLIQNINEYITQNNSAYVQDVILPESINGKEISFKTITENDDVTFLVLGLIAAVAVFFLYDKTLEEKSKKRQEQLILDFTEIVFKLSLLYEAGLSIYRAWERIVTEYDASCPDSNRYAYLEMKLVLEKIRSGVSEAESYGQFGKRCGLHQYIKLGNILEQNLSKGTKGMKDLLKQEAQEAFENRTRLARKKGEEASTKMMVPMIMMLVVVMIIVAVPAILSINF